MSDACCVCGKVLPNRWSVGKRERVDGVARCYCLLHAACADGNDGVIQKTEESKGTTMQEASGENAAAEEQALARSTSSEWAKKAWTECATLAGKLGGGVKTLWGKVHPDRSPEAMLATLNENLAGNQSRLDVMKPELDAAYRAIVAKKKEYQNAPPARQRILKVELQTLMARYRGLEQEFTILSENVRAIEQVKGRFLEVLAYGKRGALDVGMVDGLSDTVDDKADEAEDIQDALGDLDRAGRRKDRTADDFEAALSEFDGELGLAGDITTTETNRENTNEDTANDSAGNSGEHFAEQPSGVA